MASRSVTQEFLESLRQQTTNIEKTISSVNSATASIKTNNEQNQYAVGEEVQRISQQITQVIKDGMAQAARGKALLDALKKDGESLMRSNPKSERIVLLKSKYTRLCKEYVEAMKEHQKAKESMRKGQMDSVVRQVSKLPSFAGKSENEVRRKVEESGGDAAQFLKEALIEEAADEAQDAYRDAQSKAKDIEMLVRSINEVASMFQDLAVLIQHQTETLDSIERNVDQAGNFVRKGNKAVSSGAWLCCCCCCRIFSVGRAGLRHDPRYAPFHPPLTFFVSHPHKHILPHHSAQRHPGVPEEI